MFFFFYRKPLFNSITLNFNIYFPLSNLGIIFTVVYSILRNINCIIFHVIVVFFFVFPKSLCKYTILLLEFKNQRNHISVVVLNKFLHGKRQAVAFYPSYFDLPIKFSPHSLCENYKSISL